MVKCKVSITKKSSNRPVSAAGPAKAEPGQFLLIDDQNDSFEVKGQDAAGHQVDISSVATITAESDDTDVLTVDAPTGMTSTMHAVDVGVANVNVTATWNDGSVGPFSFSLPVSVEHGPANSIVIVPGTPVAR